VDEEDENVGYDFFLHNAVLVDPFSRDREIAIFVICWIGGGDRVPLLLLRSWGGEGEGWKYKNGVLLPLKSTAWTHSDSPIVIAVRHSARQSLQALALS
jgi:hypothetical protein